MVHNNWKLGLLIITDMVTKNLIPQNYNILLIIAIKLYTHDIAMVPISYYELLAILTRMIQTTVIKLSAYNVASY